MSPKKKSREKPCSKNCVDPISRKYRFDLDWRGDAACARQGSSRDLDHQTFTLRLSLRCKLLDHNLRLVINFSNDCSKLKQVLK